MWQSARAVWKRACSRVEQRWACVLLSSIINCASRRKGSKAALFEEHLLRRSGRLGSAPKEHEVAFLSGATGLGGNEKKLRYAGYKKDLCVCERGYAGCLN